MKNKEHAFRFVKKCHSIDDTDIEYPRDFLTKNLYSVALFAADSRLQGTWHGFRINTQRMRMNDPRRQKRGVKATLGEVTLEKPIQMK